MKATGIVRRIDDLGRVVIPKEIRRTLRIRVGDPLEIFTGHDGDVVFKKYSPVGELGPGTADYADALFKGIGRPIIIVDRDRCIAASGIQKSSVISKSITKEIEKSLDDRRSIFLTADAKPINALEDVETPVSASVPVISQGDVLGSVIIISRDSMPYYPTETDRKLLSVATSFLGNTLSN